MSSTYARLYVHLVWATKGREPWITIDVAPRLHGMIAGRCVALGCVPWPSVAWRSTSTRSSG